MDKLLIVHYTKTHLLPMYDSVACAGHSENTGSLSYVNSSGHDRPASFISQENVCQTPDSE